MSDDYFVLDPSHVDPARLKKEREKARKLKKSNWWLSQLNKGICHYCGEKFPRGEITMDHVIPLARGGTSTKGNIVPACRGCNAGKKLKTPVDELISKISKDRS